MNIIIDNYSQMMFQDNMCEVMSDHLKERGHNVFLNDQLRMPFYVKMKQYNPDYVMTSMGCLGADFLEYITNEKTKTIFIIFDDIYQKNNHVYELERLLIQSKVKYKLILNESCSSPHRMIATAPNNIINFSGFQTQYLLTKKEKKWGRQFDFLLLGGTEKVDLQVVTKLKKEDFKFHIHVFGGVEAIDMDRPIVQYKDILCNYKSFVFYSHSNMCLNKQFYDVCSLRKPVYFMTNSNQQLTKKSLGIDINLEFEKRNESNINFQEFHNHIAKEFSVQKQVDKLFTHLPKVK